MPSRPIARSVVLAALALSVAACDSADEDRLEADTFTLRVDGGETRTYRGSAFFSEDEVEGEELFGLLLGAAGGGLEVEAGDGPYVAFMRPGSAPRAGAYSFVDVFDTDGLGFPLGTDAFVGVYLDPSQLDIDPDGLGSTGGLFYVRSGTLTFDRVEAGDAVEGHFEVSAQGFTFVGFDPDGPFSDISIEPVGGPVRVEGAFNASFRPGLLDSDFVFETPLARRAPSRGRRTLGGQASTACAAVRVVSGVASRSRSSSVKKESVTRWRNGGNCAANVSG